MLSHLIQFYKEFYKPSQLNNLTANEVLSWPDNSNEGCTLEVD